MAQLLRTALALCILCPINAVGTAEEGISNRELVHSFVGFDSNGQERQAWLEQYQNAKASCAWKSDSEALEFHYDWFPSDKVMRESYWAYLSSQLLITTYYPDVPLWFKEFFHSLLGASKQERVQALRSQWCVTQGSSGHEFRMRRLGPFSSSGGFDWHKMKLEDPYNLRAEVQQGNVHLSGFMALPVGVDGEVIGNPPVHIHHANLGPNPNGSSLARLSQWHGDSQCSEAEGGTACYITTLPQGLGFPTSQELRLDIDFNDVRPANSTPMEFWLETAISIIKPAGPTPVHQVGTVILGVPFRYHWWNTADFQRLYFVPSDHPSALWMTARMPTSGTFVDGKLETHQHMFDKALVFSGVTPKQLGLETGARRLTKPWLPWIPHENGWTDDQAAMRSLKASVNAKFQDAVTLCASSKSCVQMPKLVWTLDHIVIEDGEEREMPWPNSTWTFEQGEVFTIVIFHKAMSMPMLMPGMTSKEIPQHLAITGYYLPKPGLEANYFFVLPSTDIESAWLDSVNWLSTLVHHGAPRSTFCAPGLQGATALAVCLAPLLLLLIGLCKMARKRMARTVKLFPKFCKMLFGHGNFSAWEFSEAIFEYKSIQVAGCVDEEAGCLSPEDSTSIGSDPESGIATTQLGNSSSLDDNEEEGLSDAGAAVL